MSLLERFFVANQVVFHFADGLVLFMLGVVAALAAHTFRASRLAVTRALPWLALFGVLVGSAKWGVVFIPLQGAYLPPNALHLLHQVQAVLLLLGHGGLLLFGLRLVPHPRWAAPLALGVGGLVAAGALTLTGPVSFEGVARALAAYALGLPGAILSGRGLLLQGQQLAPFYPRPARALRLSAWAFVLSVPLGPLAIPLEAGPPVRLWGIPVEVALIGGGLFLTLALFSGLEALRVENLQRIERAERRELLLEERYRLSKELNDGVIQDLVGAGFLMGAMEPDLPEGLRTHAKLVERQLQGAVDRLRAYLMELAPMDWEEPDLYQGLQRLVAEFQANSLLPVRLELQPGLAVEPGTGRHLYLLIHEALSNVRRHAGACEVRVSLVQAGSAWSLSVEDTGAGFDPSSRTGPGLERMATAARRAGGTLQIESKSGRGTQIALLLPVGSNGNMGAGTGT